MSPCNVPSAASGIVGSCSASEITYTFDRDGKIAGLVIAGVGERSAGRTEEFLRWARRHEPREPEALMPGGKIDPSGDHPERFRALLDRWRAATGLETIGRFGQAGDQIAPFFGIASKR